MSSHNISMLSVRKEWEVYSVVKNGRIVVRARKRLRDILPGEEPYDAVITELHWEHHLHRPAEPLHDSILELIGRRMADLVSDALAHGYLHAQQDIRKALGL